MPDDANLAAIFFLKHGPTNKIHQLDTDSAVHKLLTSSFPPLWDGGAMLATLDFFNFIGRMIPCYELEFFPNETVITDVRQWMNGNDGSVL